MSTSSRRDFFKKAGMIGAATIGLKSKKLHASSRSILSEDRMGVLVDTTLCVGCRRCEYVCKKEHGLPFGKIEEYDDRSVFNTFRRPDDKSLTVVNRYDNPHKGSLPFYVKVQCMHCDHPACVSACIVGAFSKKADGSVVYDSDKCIGCRYCMIACPFQVPAYEYGNALTPQVRKCDFCAERTAENELPACVDACPMEALLYGKRRDLITIAEERIKSDPQKYIDHIYGKSEVGGTSWLYLTGREFAELDFPRLGDKPAPGVSESIQHGIFAYFVPPLALYALLGGIMWINKHAEEEEEQ